MSTELTSSPTPVTAEAPAIAELRNVSKSFTVSHGRELKVLDQIDLSIREGELLALLVNPAPASQLCCDVSPV